jgi:hypothetical protein
LKKSEKARKELEDQIERVVKDTMKKMNLFTGRRCVKTDKTNQEAGGDSERQRGD